MSYAVKDGEDWYQMNPPDAREGDQCRLDPSHCLWRPCLKHQDASSCAAPHRRRLINPNLNAKSGEVWRIVGLKEQLPQLYEATTDGVNWNTHDCSSCRTSAEFSEHHYGQKKPVLAIRVRVQQEWPRYWIDNYYNPNGICLCRKLNKDDLGARFAKGVWYQQAGLDIELVLSQYKQFVEPIPATDAERIMRGEEMKKEIDNMTLRPDKPVPVESNTGQEICECGHLQSEHNFRTHNCMEINGLSQEFCSCQQFTPKAHPEPTPKEADVKGPQSRQVKMAWAIYEVLAPNIINISHHVAIERIGEQLLKQPPPQPISVKETLPQVYLTSRCIPNPRTSFWYLMENETEWILSTTILQTEHEVRKYVASIGAVKWMRCEPPYAIPPTPTESDDGFEKVETVHQWIRNHQKRFGRYLTDAECELVQAAWTAANADKKKGDE